jgi:hypothetical protein
MERKNLFALAFTLHAAFLLLNPGCAVAAQIQPPEAFIGHRVGADYKLARYEKIRQYFQQVGENSRRVNVRDIGITTEGRNMIIAEITDDASPARIEQAVAQQKQIADPRLIKNERQRMMPPRHESNRRSRNKSKLPILA